MMRTEPHIDVSELAKVTARALVVFADDDIMTLHFLTQEKPHLVDAIPLDFLTNGPVPVVAPVGRAPRDG
jgi:hypothetical protein